VAEIAVMGLSFLTPLLLAGAGLVAVPLILHLLMKQRPVPREFPALRFLRVRAVANRRRLRLQHLLLLALRMGALALLAVALARPTLRGAGWLADGEGPIAAVLVFDTAPRMLLREGNRTRLEQAVELARLLFGKLPKGSTVAVLDTGGRHPDADLGRRRRGWFPPPRVGDPDAPRALPVYRWFTGRVGGRRGGRVGRRASRHQPPGH
jgi:hypothetical protein